MIAAIELSKEYVQICVKTPSLREPESVTKVAGTEYYRMPVECDLKDCGKVRELFRSLWKMLTPYGNRESLKYLMFCLEENSGEMRDMLTKIVEEYHIPTEKVRFLDKAECFASYVWNQSGELLSHNALLVENHHGMKEKYLLHKCTGTLPVVTKVWNVSEETLEDVFKDHAISSVFLVGDDFEEEWMESNLKILKTGRRVFLGKNLYVKGACYKGMELAQDRIDYLFLGAEKVCCHIALRARKDGKMMDLPIAEGGKNWYESDTSDDFEEEWMESNLKILKTGRRVFLGKNLYVKGACYKGMELAQDRIDYLFLGAEKVCCHIALRARKDGKMMDLPIAEGGKNWYESDTSVEVLLLEEPVLEVAIIPLSGKEKKTFAISLDNLPKRPKRTTRLLVSLQFKDSSHAKILVKDLGFGELFPQSDMVYEGELQWEQ